MSTGSGAPPRPARFARRPPPRARLPLALIGLLVSLLLSTLLVTPGASAADDTSDQGDAGPLRVVLTGLSPAVVPRSGPLTLTGTVTNTDEEQWRNVKVYTWASDTPMTTSEELQRAARTPYDAAVGSRLTAARTFVTVGDLDPGESESFAISVPRDRLPMRERAGVYWIGLQALGTSVEGRDNTADGRARTFIPLVDPSARRSPVPASFVLPLRQEVRRDPDGRLHDPDGWGRLLGPDGRLGRLLGLGGTAGSLPVTLLLDPAVLDAAGVLAAGGRDNNDNNGRDGGKDGSDNGDGTDLTGDAAVASGWLERAVDLARRRTTLALGYADPDTASLARRSPALLDQARRLSGSSLSVRGIDDATPAVAPVDGVLPGASFSVLAGGTQVLLSSRAAPDAESTLTRTGDGQPLALVDTGATSDGPGPGAVDDALTFRQRILAEGALRQVRGDRSQLVVVPPADWDPGSDWRSSAFFSSLQVPWLSWRALGSRARIGDPVEDPAYAASDRRAQVGDRLVGATRSAARSGRTFASVLERPRGSADTYGRLALRGVSYWARDDRDQAYGDVRALGESVRGRLDRVKVSGSSFVTLSGGSGSFVVSLVNDLDRPVKVGLAATTSNADLTLRLPRSVVLPARQRTTVPIRVDSTQTGVRAVTITPTTPSGFPIGSALMFNVRDSQVSSLIWAVLGAGVLLLVAMIYRRIRKQGGLRRQAGSSAP